MGLGEDEGLQLPDYIELALERLHNGEEDWNGIIYYHHTISSHEVRGTWEAAITLFKESNFIPYRIIYKRADDGRKKLDIKIEQRNISQKNTRELSQIVADLEQSEGWNVKILCTHPTLEQNGLLYINKGAKSFIPQNCRAATSACCPIMESQKTLSNS